MTINSQIRTAGPFVGTGVLVAYPFGFKVFQTSDLLLRSTSADGTITTLVLSSNYTVTLNADQDIAPGGVINLVVALPVGTSLIATSNIVAIQPTSLTNGGAFFAKVIEAALDRLTILMQQLGIVGIVQALRVPEIGGVPELPSAANRALRILSFDSLGNPLMIAGVDSGSAAALALDLVNSVSASKGAALIGYGDSIAYASGVGLQLRKYGINLAAWPGVDSTGATDTSPAIRLAMAEATSSGRPLYWNSGTYLVSGDPASPLVGALRTYCIKPANNAVWFMGAGAAIKLANGGASWIRVVSFQNTTGVRVFGELRVDANAANISGTNNEHMHGVFIFDTSNCYIERIDSQNARGDNVFIGGTDQSTYGRNVTIGSIYAKVAGRKNLTLHYCDALSIGIADLDNSTGGAALYGGVADTTDRHSLDVEPDAFTAARRFEQSIGRLRTFGLGNDFTAGTTPAHGDNWILNIGHAECVQSASSATVPAWEQNAITINVGSLSITGCAGIDDAVRVNYAARLIGDSLSISGASATAAGYLLKLAATGTDDNRPEIDFKRLNISNTVGGGANFRSAVGNIGTLKAKCVGYALEVGDNVISASYRGSMSIDHLVTRDTGIPTTGAIVSLVTYTIAGYALTVRKATVMDTRGTKTGAIFQVGAGNAVGLTIGEAVNPEAIPLVNWLSTDKFYRIGGSYYTATNTGPASFVCFGTPEGMVPSMIGSAAMRQDGGAGTSLYVKQSGTGTAGWVGK